MTQPTTTLLLVRHGKAETASGKSDGERKLTDEGAEELRAAGSALRAAGFRVDAVVTSPLVRARETAALLSGELAGGREPMDENALAPGALADAVVAAARRAGGRCVAVVGHAPDLTGIVTALVAPGGRRTAGFGPGGMCCIDFAGPVALGAGTLRWAASCAEIAGGSL